MIGRVALAAAALFAAQVTLAQSTPPSFTTWARYDLERRVTGTIAPNDGSGFAAVRNSYDAQGRLVKVEQGKLAAWQPESVAPADWESHTIFTIFRVIDTTYDVDGRKLSETLSVGGVAQTRTQWSYDALDRVVCMAVRMTPASNFASAPADACVQTSGASEPDRITKTLYDAQQRVSVVQKAFSTSLQQDYVSYTYTANGKQASVTDAHGATASYAYDALDRMQRWYFPSKTTAGVASTSDYEEYGYDANGNRTSLRKRDAQMIGYSYDALNRVVVKDIPGGTSADVYYGYDLQGHQLYARFGSATGAGLTNVYDGLGRLTSATNDMDGTARTLLYNYNQDGGRKNILHPDGALFRTIYDNLDRPVAIQENGTTQIVSISYDNQGRRQRLDRVGASTTYGYDNAGRLATLSDDQVGTATDLTSTFSYNAASQMTGRLRNNDAYVYGGDVSLTRQYTVNGLNQYVTAGPASFTYDPNGNLTSDGSVTFGYDTENRLVSASGTKTAALRYDPMGRLYETVGTVNGGTVTTRFLYDGDELVAEYDSAGTMLKRYVHGPSDDDPLLWYEGASLATRRQIFTDHQGSVVSIADGAGSNIAINKYDEWGVPGTNTGRFQYTGQAWIAELGMYYYKARFYSPTLGRFMQTDPIGYKDQVNLYAYVGSDPVDGRDPSGTQCDLSCPEYPKPLPPANSAPGVTITVGTTVGGNLGPVNLSLTTGGSVDNQGNTAAVVDKAANLQNTVGVHGTAGPTISIANGHVTDQAGPFTTGHVQIGPVSGTAFSGTNEKSQIVSGVSVTIGGAGVSGGAGKNNTTVNPTGTIGDVARNFVAAHIPLLTAVLPSIFPPACNDHGCGK